MRQHPLLMSLLLLGARTTTAASDSSTSMPYPVTNELNVLLPRYDGLYPRHPYTATNYLPTTSFPLTFAYQYTNDPNANSIALRPRIVWEMFQVYGNATQAQIYGVTTDLFRPSTSIFTSIDDTYPTDSSPYYLTFNLYPPRW